MASQSASSQYMDSLRKAFSSSRTFDFRYESNNYPVVETPNASKWFYGKGKVTEEIIENYMPSPKGRQKIIL